jgi:hypothetical protein
LLPLHPHLLLAVKKKKLLPHLLLRQHLHLLPL